MSSGAGPSGRGSLAYRRRGEGEPVVLLHGIGSRRQVWEPLVAELGGSLDLVLVDLPGHGDSGPLAPDRRWGVDAYVDALERFLDELGLERAHLLGNSLGGAAALELARRGRARSVVALAPIGFWRGPEISWGVASLRASLLLAERLGELGPRLVRRPRARAVLLAQLFGRPRALAAPIAAEELRAFVAAAPAVRASLPWTRRYRFRGPAPAVPTMVAWGRRDYLLWPWQAARAERALPLAQHRVLERGGHLLMVDEPATTARLVAGLIEAVAGSPDTASTTAR
jgi:pimeloyl-ACP methyl ester carboxylesterase